MLKKCAMSFLQCALLLCLAEPVIGGLPAQASLSATARIAARPLTSGSDSGKLILSVKISGTLDLKRDQVIVVDEAGRISTLLGVAIRPSATPLTSLVTTYLPPAPKNVTERQYLFFVAPGSRTFELRVGTLKPLRITPLVESPR
jgi:hypothetical protein